MKTGHRLRFETLCGPVAPVGTRTDAARWRRSLAGLAMAALLGACPVAVQADVDHGSLPRPQQGPVAGTGQTGQHWAAMSGSTLKDTLETWSRSSGWTVVWDTEMNYRLRASATFSGNFQRVVTALVDSIHVNNPELTVTLYTGNRVIHVQTLLNETR